MGPTRVQRIAKKLIEEAAEDRQLALDAHRFFRGMVDENPQDSVSKAQMVDCLKLAQTSKNNIVKVMDLMVKIDTMKEREKGSKPVISDVFSHLETLARHDK